MSNIFIVSEFHSWIEDAHEKSLDFDCGIQELNTYIQNETHPEKKLHANNVTIADIDGNLAGYISYTISKVVPGSNTADQNDGYPYLIVEYFAVDNRYKGLGVGRQLMLQVIKVTSRLYLDVMIHGIYLTALRTAVDYYTEVFEFKVLNPYALRNPGFTGAIPMKLDILAVLDIAFAIDD